MDRPEAGFDLIVTIVNRGYAEEVITASRGAGAEGGTVLPGRGLGIHEQKKILGIPVEPEKEIVLTVARSNCTDTIVEAIRRTVELDKPGRGIGFVLSLKQVVGIAHFGGGTDCEEEPSG